MGPHSWACIGGGDDVFHSYGANQGFVVNGDTCLVVDSGFHNKTASQVFSRIRRLGAKRLLLVDTHYHSDHVFGNSVFATRGATVLSHDKCRKTMKAKSPGLLSKYRTRDPKLARILSGVTISYPSLTYKDSVALFVGDETNTVVFHPRGRAHTDGDSIVHVPQDRVVFAGDVLWTGYHPNLEDSDIQGQVRALKMILRLNPRKVVPGHGQVCGLQEVRRFIRYLEELDKNTRTAVKEGHGLEETLQRAIPAWAGEWRMRRLAEAYVRRMATKSPA